MGINPREPAFDGAYIWVANELSGRVGKIDIVTNAVAATLIIIFSAALGIYYLFVNSETRLGARSPR